MKKLILALAALALSHAVLAAKPLLSPAELQPLLSNPAVRVIDARDPKSYALQHIPGAVNAPYGNWRGPATNPGTVPELPTISFRLCRSPRASRLMSWVRRAASTPK